MIRMLAVCLALAAPLLSQAGPSFPFAMTGGALSVGGTFGSPSGNSIWPTCSGTATMGGQSYGFGPSKPFMHNGLAKWRFNVTFNDVVYIIVIEINPNAAPGHQLSGYWYPAMSIHLVQPLTP